MPKHVDSRVFGRAPRKALAVKPASKKDAGPAKPQKKHAKDAALTTALMASSPQPLQTRDMNIQSILRSPRSTDATPPSSPTYKPEEWRSSVATLAARIDVERAELRALKDRVQQMEQDAGFPKKAAAEDGRSAAGGRSVVDDRSAGDERLAPASLFGE